MPESRVLFFQPALPAYRVDFFDRLSRLLGDRFRLYFSPTPMGALTEERPAFSWARPVGLMRPLLPGIEWQRGVMNVPVERGDTVIVCGGPRTVSTLVLLLKARLNGARSIWFGHLWSSTTRLHRFYLRILLMKLADAVLFYTDQEIDEYRRGVGSRDRRPLSAVNNGIDVDSVANVRTPYSAAGRDKRVVFIGRLTDKCRLEIAIRALADPRLEGVSLDIIGDGPLRPTLEGLVAELGMEDRIVWHGGTVDERTIARIANRCRLFIYPGEVGLSLIHAMAYGLPALITNSRWTNNPEITAFHDGRTGKAFAEGSSASLADRLADVIDDIRSLDRWSAHCIDQADKSYNTRSMAARVVELVDRIAIHERRK